ncbi:aryl-sulfate sulfotransferase [Aurantibacillus circumpalustris]|uniref:aryl-sulfate sulfotransferase n=1 Tax=Aurantibacillus circumpalustris TaxID=3036359 RepID=UPI00295A799B|nr:aryl-sulfate sulfotransferase [Aurantibacillus circumpalustris]
MNFKALIAFCLLNSIALSQGNYGVLKKVDCSQSGYILFAPLFSKNTYLIDKCGREVHKWKSAYTPAQSAYFLPNGKLLRTGNDTITPGYTNRGGIIEILNWKSEVVWSYKIADSSQRQHHDVCPMPNGNIVVLVYDRKSGEQAMNMGRDTAIKSKWIWSEKIIELQPIGKNEANIVWEWKVWDHLIQDFDKSLPNYGLVADNPQRININFLASSDEDWLHFNSIDYNEQLNQILISNRNFSEIFILDHSTTTVEASSNKGGKQNKGGDLLFRWGNPMSYKRGNPEIQTFFNQHNARWIKKGLKDEGKIIVFNNGLNRPGELHSTVDIINPQIDDKNNYQLSSGLTYLPEKPYSQYGEDETNGFYSSNVSSAQRLSNGNTLICEGENGRFFEIDKSGDVVWAYINPIGLFKILQNGSHPDKNQVFRCFLYEPSYPGFRGNQLRLGKTIEINPGLKDCKINFLKRSDCNSK